MISPEQLAIALERLDPRDRELLALSLRRRVPDEDLARMYDIESPEIARRRAAAIEHLADSLGVQRGEDLGAVLKALLEEETWSASEALSESAAADERTPDRAVPPAEGAVAGAAEPVDPVPSAQPDSPPAPARADSRPDPAQADPSAAPPQQGPPPDSTQPAPSPASAQPDAHPAEAPGSAPSPAQPAVAAAVPSPPPEQRRFPHLALAFFGTGIAALLAAIALLGVGEVGDSGRAAEGGTESGDGTRHFVPANVGPGAAPFPSEPQTASCYPTAVARGRTTLYRRPGGPRLIRVSARTEWKSPRVFGVVRREGDWLAVQASELPNGKVGWLRASDARLDCTTWSLHADLSKRMLFVRREGKTVRKFRVAIGRPGNDTPKGRFSVTDKLRVTDPASPYGCCVLALTGHQTNLPPDWPGGDRLAVHATSDETSIGQAASLGCLRTMSRHAKWLIETIPLGAPIFIRS